MEKAYERSALLFSFTGERVNVVLNKFVKSPQRPANPQKVLADYVRKVVFDWPSSGEALAGVWERDAENANRILHIFHKAFPHLLGKLVLESFVSGYTNDNALPLLENVQMYLRSKLADSRDWAFVDTSASALSASDPLPPKPSDKHKSLWEAYGHATPQLPLYYASVRIQT